MTNGPNQPGNPDLTPEIFEQADWSEVVDRYGKANLDRIKGVSDEIKAKIIAAMGRTEGGRDNAEMRVAIEHYKRGKMSEPERTKAAIKHLYSDLFGVVDPGEAVVNFHTGASDDTTEDEIDATSEDTVPYVNIPDDVDGDQSGDVSPEAVAVSETVVPVEILNRYLKLQVRTKDGKPDLTKRDDLSIGIKLLRELAAEEGANFKDVLDGKVMESMSQAKLFKNERGVASAEGDVSKLAEAAKFLGDASAKKFNELVVKAGASKINIDGNDVDIEDRSHEISQLKQQIDVSKSELSNPKLAASVAGSPLLVDMYGKEIKNSVETDVSERKTIRSDVAENIRKLAVAEKIQKAFEERERFVKELHEALTTLFGHLSVLVKNGCFSEEAEARNVNSRLDELNAMSRSLKFSKLSEIVKFLIGHDGRGGILSQDKKKSVLEASDKKREKMADELRTNKKDLEFAKKNAEGNTDLTDSAFALRIIKYKLLKDPENKKLSLEDLEKLAKRTLVEELWKFRTQKVLGEAVDGAPTDLLKIFEDVAMKEKVLKFNYKVGDAKKEPFKGLTPNDLKDEKSIENLFASGRVDLKKAFMLLGVIGKVGGGASTAQYRFLQKKIFDLLGEEGLTPAQAIKAFNDQMEKIEAVALKYVDGVEKSAASNKKIKELKTEKAMEKYRRGEMDYDQLQDELEDAGVLKEGKLTEGSVSRLGLYTGYLWNSRQAQKVRDRLTDVARDTGKFLGRNLLVAPLYLSAKWALKGGVSLAGSAIAKPFRLLGYPLALLKAPWHVIMHPIKIFKKPGEVFKEAGGKVKETWTAKAKATEERRKKRWEGAKAEFGKWKEPFKGPKYEWKSSYVEDAKKNPSKDLAKLDAQVDRLKKKVEEAEVVLTEEPFLDYSKYKTKTDEEVKKAA
jgi:hypothetical protein